jgi:membrane protease YdiL (CAAX protease family)
MKLFTSSLTEQDSRRRFFWVGWSLTALTAVMLLASFALQLMVVWCFPDYATAWWMNWVLSLVPLYAVALPCMLLLLRFAPPSPHNGDFTDKQGVARIKPRFHVGHWLILLCIAFGCLYGGGLAGSLTMSLLSTVTGHDYASGLNTLVESSPVWMTVLGACIIAPFGEELIFRKLLIDRTRHAGDLPAILLSGLFFGLFHGNLFQFFYAFLIGMLLAYVYTRSGSYLWCVAMHATVNLFGSVIVPALLKLLPEGVPEDPLQILLALAIATWQYGLIAAAMVLLIVLWRQRKLSRGSCPLDPRRTVSVILLNPGIIAAATVMLILLLSNLILPLIPSG